MLMFVMTEEWLKVNYGSKDAHQELDAKNWLLKYGKDVPEDRFDLWCKYKHLVEYQVNTLDIVEVALANVGQMFDSELCAHMFINRMRVPGQSEAYLRALKKIDPSTILELGVGGDSAISTSVFLAHIEPKINPRLLSVDRHPLGCTWKRYGEIPFWEFVQDDSVKRMDALIAKGERFDLVFVDTSHDYRNTKNELDRACQLADAILMDDAEFTGNDFDSEPGGVKRALEDWMLSAPSWEKEMYKGLNVALVYKKVKPKSKIIIPAKKKSKSGRKRS